jgi:hypothetical protein
VEDSAAPIELVPTSPPIWRWVLATAIASPAGLFCAILLTVPLVLLSFEVFGRMGVLIVAIKTGWAFAIGLAQYCFLRGHIRTPILWPIITALGIGSGWVLFIAVSTSRGELGVSYDVYRMIIDTIGASAFASADLAFRAILPGFSVGLFQWMILKQRTRKTLIT